MAQQQKKSMLTLELICEFEKERDFCVKEGILNLKVNISLKTLTILSYLENSTYSIEELKEEDGVGGGFSKGN